jgi:hypothetical protein
MLLKTRVSTICLFIRKEGINRVKRSQRSQVFMTIMTSFDYCDLLIMKLKN